MAAMNDGEIVLLENLRFHPEETTNDPAFSAALAGLADVYVNDAFAVSHRAHASVVGVAERIVQRGRVSAADGDGLFPPGHGCPGTAAGGGCRRGQGLSKLGALENMLDRVDRMIIGGAMANTFLKSQGIAVGASKVEDDLLPVAEKLVADAAARGSSSTCRWTLSSLIALPPMRW